MEGFEAKKELVQLHQENWGWQPKRNNVIRLNQTRRWKLQILCWENVNSPLCE